MSNNPLALTDSLMGLPKGADYDALYAVLAGSERGRWFLTEFAQRNRHADTDVLVRAIARIEAAIRGDPLPPAQTGGHRELIEVAVAIARIEAEITAAEALAPAGYRALERIQDIAYVLHERSVEATLCDDLDAAIREISDACARADTAAARTRNAAELLRTLANCVGESIAQCRASPPAAENAAGTNDATLDASEDASRFAEIVDHAPTRALLFDLEAEQAENFARAAAALVALLPTLANSGEPARDSQNDPVEQPRSVSFKDHREGSGEMLADWVPADVSAAKDQGVGQATLIEAAALARLAAGPAPLADANPAAATDALAALRALSEEELIALFS